MSRSVVVGVAAMSLVGLSACGSSGFTGSVKLETLYGTTVIASSDNDATCTVPKSKSGSVALKDASGKIVSIGDVGAGTGGRPHADLVGETTYAACKDIPVTFSDVPAGAGPYQITINDGNPVLLAEQQLEGGSVTLVLNPAGFLSLA